MTSAELENLVSIGKLKRESFSQSEFSGLLQSGAARLADARNEKLALESRFDLAYNAAHALSLAALRYAGYRSDRRNRAEYEGSLAIDAQLVKDTIAAAEAVLKAVRKRKAK